MSLDVVNGRSSYRLQVEGMISGTALGAPQIFRVASTLRPRVTAPLVSDRPVETCVMPFGSRISGTLRNSTGSDYSGR